jgi:hypothetical protein
MFTALCDATSRGPVMDRAIIRGMLARTVIAFVLAVTVADAPTGERVPPDTNAASAPVVLVV